MKRLIGLILSIAMIAVAVPTGSHKPTYAVGLWGDSDICQPCHVSRVRPATWPSRGRIAVVCTPANVIPPKAGNVDKSWSEQVTPPNETTPTRSEQVTPRRCYVNGLLSTIHYSLFTAFALAPKSSLQSKSSEKFRWAWTYNYFTTAAKRIFGGVNLFEPSSVETDPREKSLRRIVESVDWSPLEKEWPQVYLNNQLGAVIKTAGYIEMIGMWLRDLIYEGYDAIKSGAGGLTARTTVLRNVTVRLDGRPKKVSYLIVQEKLEPLSKKFKDLSSEIDRLNEAGREEDAGLVLAEAKTLIDKFIQLQNRLWERGVIDCDYILNNYGVDKNGQLFLFDFDMACLDVIRVPVNFNELHDINILMLAQMNKTLARYYNEKARNEIQWEKIKPALNKNISARRPIEYPPVEEWAVKASLTLPASVVKKEAVNVPDKYDFSYNNGKYAVYYADGVRYEVYHGGTALSFDIEDPERDWQTELLEISIELDKIRDQIAKDLFERYPDIKDNANWDMRFIKEDKDARIAWMKNIIGIRYKNPDFSFVDELEGRFIKARGVFKKLLEVKNRTPQIIVNVVENRATRGRKLQDFLRDVAPQTINIYLDNQSAAGVMGRARLIADGILSAVPNAKISMYVLGGNIEPEGVQFVRYQDPRISIREVTRDELNQFLNESRVHICVSGNISELSSEAGAVFTANPFPNVQNWKKDSIKYFAAKTNNDLRDPYGTVYLDAGLRQRRTLRDRWPLVKLILERVKWLASNLSYDQFRSLNDLGEEGGWDASKSIWTWGYFQDSSRLMLEMDVAASLFGSQDIDKIPFRKGGRQLVLHLIPGIHTIAADKFFISHIVHTKGMTVITTDGSVIKPRHGGIPITVVLHNAIENAKLKTLQSELSGTTVRDPSDKFWIDFPAYVTGAASWLEAVSCGSIFVHDDYDTGVVMKRPIIRSTLVRMLSLRYGTAGVKKSFDELEKEAEFLLEDYVMAYGDHYDRYRDLEAWTRKAREYSDAMYKFNMIDDICAEIVRIDMEKKGTAAEPVSRELNEGLRAKPVIDEAA